MQSKNFKIGDRVQSTYRACWHGIVVDYKWESGLNGKIDHCIYLVLPILTCDGRPQRKAKIHTLNGHWLRNSSMIMELPKNS